MKRVQGCTYGCEDEKRYEGSLGGEEGQEVLKAKKRVI